MRGAESLSRNVRGLNLSATVGINELSARLAREGRAITRLGLGQSPFPVPSVVVTALCANAARKDYLPVRGLDELREAVADYHRRRIDIACSADDVLVGPGSKELMFLLQVVFHGELVVPTPAWVSYMPQARIVGRRISCVHTSRANGYRLTPSELERACRADPRCPRIVVLNYPCNPTGGTYRAEELAGLAEVARRFGILVLSDEIYGELDYSGAHVSIARAYPEGTIVSSGLSKWCGAGGWRLGTFVFPAGLRWLMNAMAAVASETYTSTSSPVQYAAVEAFRGGAAIERYLWRARRILAALAHACVARLREAGLEVLTPDGAFYLFPDFSPLRRALAERGIVSSADITAHLLKEAGVAALPGSEFGRDPQELSIRLALVDFDGAKAMAALEAMPPDTAVDREFVGVHCRAVVEAVDRIAVWVSGLE